MASSNPGGGTKGFLVQASAPVSTDFRTYVRFTYADFDRDSTAETGAGILGYTVSPASARMALAEGGLLWSHSWVVGDGIELRPRCS